MHEMLSKVVKEVDLNETNKSSVANDSVLGDSFMGDESLLEGNQPSYVQNVLQNAGSDVESSVAQSDFDSDSDSGFLDDGSEMGSLTDDVVSSSPNNTRPTYVGSCNDDLLSTSQDGLTFDEFLDGLNNKEKDDYHSETIDEMKSSKETPNCTETDYLKHLLNRRGRQSSPRSNNTGLQSLMFEDKSKASTSESHCSQDNFLSPDKIIKTENLQNGTSHDNDEKNSCLDSHGICEAGNKTLCPEKNYVNSTSVELDANINKPKNICEKTCVQPKFQENDQNQVERVPCPICEKKISLNRINSHLDVCTGSVDKQDALRTRNLSDLSSAQSRRTQLKPQGKQDRSVRSNSARMNPAIRKMNSMPTGMENLQAALEKTLLSNQTMKQKMKEKEVEEILMQKQKESEKKRTEKKKRKRRSRFAKRRVKRNVEVNKSVDEDSAEDNEIVGSCTEESSTVVANISKPLIPEELHIQQDKVKQENITSSPINCEDLASTINHIVNNSISKALVDNSSFDNTAKVSIDESQHLNVTEKPTPMVIDEPLEAATVVKQENVNGGSDICQVKASLNVSAGGSTDASSIKKERLKKMPIRVKFTPKRRVRTYSSSEHEETEESEEEMDKEEDTIPQLLQPTRRSSRAVKKSTYCEASSDEEEKVEKKRKVPSKYKAKKKKKVDDDDEYKLSEHSEDDKEEILSNDESAQNKSRGSDEDGEVGPSDINIDELLEKKFYRPDQKSVFEAVEDVGGIRYFNDQMVNPAQPKLLCGGMLRDYQITGYQWLKIMYENGESGILADEMGLGKTIQAIAMVCKLVEVGVNGPFLVCAPTTTVANWFHEFKKFAPKISLMLYHGTAPERYHLIETLMEHLNDKTQVVVITSYEILLRDRPALMKYSWGYLILDEGHRVKNSNSRTIKELKKLTIRGKLMLTGTPIQNNLTELWSLLNFLLPAVFDDMAIFRSWFNLDVLQKDEKVLSMLHQVLTPFLLRRSKSDVDIKIPPKREMLVMAPLACLQEKFYRATVDRSIRHLLINKDYFNITPGVAHPDLIASNSQEMKDETSIKYPTTRSKTIGSTKRTIEPDDDFVVNVTLNNMIMQLRKCCNHPYLIQYPLQPGTDIFKVDEDLITSCGKMMLLDRMLPVLKERKHKVLLFSQMTSMLDVLQDYCVMRKFSFVRFDGSTKCEDRFAYIEEFNNDPNIFLFLLSTRAGGLGINLTGADTVIIYDSDWNPQNDSQAQDRCHRIGQERPVMVYRMVTMATIDQQIMERAARKRTMEKMIMHEDKFKNKLAMELNKVVSPDELLNLLQSNSLEHVAENKESIISDEELNQMLDRSSLKQNQPTMEDVSHKSTITDSPKARFQIIRTTVDTISV
ncbi:uncharacterized protein LOC100186186 [Ciona intestinalis]